MKIGAYQFPVSGDVTDNYKIMEKAIKDASRQGVELLAFPECALTGYPPYDIPDSKAVDFELVDRALLALEVVAARENINVIVGTIYKEDNKIYNSAVLLTKDGERYFYHKRALWGWDKDNFDIGNENGVYEINGLKIGIRICFEVRFPEFFRELYKENTDLNIILFYDSADNDNIARYNTIEGHIKTRAVENVCYTLTSNTIKLYQTAPTALYDRSGRMLAGCERNKEGMFVYDFEKKALDFGEMGRKELSDILLDL
ncbi:MAG: carbon-nitrogen hydrolase family protein [Clostridia bacterium]|nr:carbon-nitrogen hydrolase family protein [Clostridia bacterium]